jgi:hypothetical protein
MEKLSTDMTVEIASRVAAAVANPIEDLGSLWATYSQMRRVCGDIVVGRSIPLLWVLLRGIHVGTWNWFYDHKYHAKLIARLASVDNLEAYFYVGMHAVFVEDHSALMPWLDMLERSATTSHDVVVFVLSLVLHRSNSGADNDNIARQWLREVKGDEAGLAANVTWKNEICTRCLQLAMFVLQDLVGRLTPGESSPLPPLAMSVHRQDGHQCGGGGYSVHAGWEGWEEWAMFCSEECRIRNECDRFFRSMW